MASRTVGPTPARSARVAARAWAWAKYRSSKRLLCVLCRYKRLKDGNGDSGAPSNAAASGTGAPKASKRRAGLPCPSVSLYEVPSGASKNIEITVASALIFVVLVALPQSDARRKTSGKTTITIRVDPAAVDHFLS